MYEALYYLANPHAFIAEARRVLRPGGQLIVCTVNREWVDFNPSPFSTAYHSATELRALLEHGGFQTAMFAAFPVQQASLRDHVCRSSSGRPSSLDLCRRRCGGKRLLKRLFFGRLVVFPPELREDMAPYREPVPLAGGGQVSGYKVLYAVGAVVIGPSLRRLAARHRRSVILLAQFALAALSNYFAFLLRFDGGPIPKSMSGRF
jgi:hypothetical protein